VTVTLAKLAFETAWEMSLLVQMSAIATRRFVLAQLVSSAEKKIIQTTLADAPSLITNRSTRKLIIAQCTLATPAAPITMC